MQNLFLRRTHYTTMNGRKSICVASGLLPWLSAGSELSAIFIPLPPEFMGDKWISNYMARHSHSVFLIRGPFHLSTRSGVDKKESPLHTRQEGLQWMSGRKRLRIQLKLRGWWSKYTRRILIGWESHDTFLRNKTFGEERVFVATTLTTFHYTACMNRGTNCLR